MKKINYLFLLFVLFLFLNLFTINNISQIIIRVCNIWLNNLIPSIFPFYTISDLLINYGFIDILNFALEKPFNKLFKIKGSATFVFIFSMFTGFPSNAKYIDSLLKEDLISIEEANKIIRFTHFSNPLFIVNTIGLNILGNKLIGYFILFSHFFSNFIIAFIFRNEKSNSNSNKKVNHETFGKVITNSINNTFNSLLIILGNIITFQILLAIIFKYLKFNHSFKIIVNLLLEITSGLFELKSLNISLAIKAIIATFSLSFGGLCVHSQVYSILSENKIKYKNYLISRILHAIIASIIMAIILFFHRI